MSTEQLAEKTREQIIEDMKLAFKVLSGFHISQIPFIEMSPETAGYIRLRLSNELGGELFVVKVDRKSKGEKKRQRSQWNRSMKK